MTDNQPASDGRTRPFADVLLDLSKGRTHAELSSSLQQLVAAVQDTGKAGTLTLTVKVNPSKADDVLDITETVALKAPRKPRPATIFYVTDDHNLTRDNPNQLRLPLREVPDTDTDTVERAQLREA